MISNVNLLQSFLSTLLLVYENIYYLQVYLDNCAYKIDEIDEINETFENYQQIIKLMKISF